MQPFLRFVLLCCILSVSAAHAQDSFYKNLQTRFILAEDGDTILLDEGTFLLQSGLSLDGKKNILIKGKGKDKTILSFQPQKEGAEGILITACENVRVEDLTVQDTRGDAIKAKNVKGITFRNVKTAWSGPPSPRNGAYGLYPVQCEDVLITHCEATGASDAGIYVGQSRNIVVRNSKAFHNVAGIEIENSTDAEVYDNEATENTGGILVFDLPDLEVKKGGHVKVYRNNIHHNNLPNFAPKGNIVAKVPAGTGVLVLATSDVSIFENRIVNNNTLGTGVISYFMTENPIRDSLYNPYPEKIVIHGNTFEREHTRPSMKGRMGMMFRFKLRFGKDVPHILWDGIRQNTGPAPVLCIYDNKEETFANMDAGNNFKNVSRELPSAQCRTAFNTGGK